MLLAINSIAKFDKMIVKRKKYSFSGMKFAVSRLRGIENKQTNKQTNNVETGSGRTGLYAPKN